MLWLVLVCACACSVGVGAVWEPAAVAFSVETTVLLGRAGEAAAQSRGEGPGYRLSAELAVLPIAGDQHDTLLQLQLGSVQLHGRGAHPRADWLPRASPADTWLQPAHLLLRAGRLRALHLPPGIHPDHANYWRALASLLQYQETAGEREEEDVSGTCQVQYEVISDQEFRKIKRACVWNNVSEAWDGAASWRRVARYTRGAGGEGLAGVYAEEVVEAGEGAARVKARSWTRLTLQAAAPRAAPLVASLQEALSTLPRAAPLPLQTTADPEAEMYDDLELEEVVAQALGVVHGAEPRGGEDAGAGDEAAGGGGSARQAAAVLAALPALRRAAQPALAALLEHYTDMPALLPGVVRLLGLAGTVAAHGAARALLQLRTEPLRPLADVYLDALALAPLPDEEVVRGVVQLGGAARDRRVAGAALLAAAAAAPRLSAAGAAVPLADTVRDTIATQLARCKDDECKSVRLLALGNLRRSDTVELLLQHAEAGRRGVALAALDALDAAPAQLPAAALRRLLRVAQAGRPLVVRAAALDLALRRYCARGVPVVLARVARDLQRAPPELRRVFWQRLDALAAGGLEPARALLAQLPPELRGWGAATGGGTSSVLARGAGWGAAGWSAALQSVQVAAGGLLQRGEVLLHATDPHNATHPALGVQLWTSGLGSVTGGGGGAGAGEDEPAGEEDEAAGAGLAFSVAGVRLLPVTMFTGQAELMGHVWAGTGSTLTPALRAVAPLRLRTGTLPLQAGVALWLGAGASLAAALDAQAQVSLWSRTARTELRARTGLALETRARLRTALADLRLRAAAASDPAMHIAADIDFYDKVEFCVRVHIHDHDYRYNTTSRSELGARSWRVRRERAQVTPRAGRTLALGADNDRACAALPPAPLT